MIEKFLKNSQKFLLDNSPAILTAIGVVGTVTTAVLSARAAVQATEIIREARHDASLMNRQEPDLRERAALTWDVWLPPVLSGGLTVGATIGSNYVSSRRITALAAAYAIAERAFDEYRDKVKERIGDRRERSIRDDIAQDRVDRNPVSASHVHVTGNGDVLCYDAYTGRYFYSTMEDLRRAQNDINYSVINHSYASLTDFYGLIGLDQTKFSDEIGWNVDNLLEIQFSTTLSDDGRPCMVVDFRTAPVRYFNRLQ